MFDISVWLVAGIKSGYDTGQYSFATTTELTAAYLSKGLISVDQAQEIAEDCPEPTVLPEETMVI